MAHTKASGLLVCNDVIHAVGPIWACYANKAECAAELQQTIYNALVYADDKLAAHTIALPAISTGEKSTCKQFKYQ